MKSSRNSPRNRVWGWPTWPKIMLVKFQARSMLGRYVFCVFLNFWLDVFFFHGWPQKHAVHPFPIYDLNLHEFKQLVNVWSSFNSSTYLTSNRSWKNVHVEGELWCVSNKQRFPTVTMMLKQWFFNHHFFWPTKIPQQRWDFFVNPPRGWITSPPALQVTHDGPHGIFDLTGGGHWGSSQELLGAIYRIKPKVGPVVGRMLPQRRSKTTVLGKPQNGEGNM